VNGIPALFWYSRGELIDEAVGFTKSEDVLAVFDD
jgi:hypothetical protein